VPQERSRRDDRAAHREAGGGKAAEEAGAGGRSEAGDPPARRHRLLRGSRRRTPRQALAQDRATRALNRASVAIGALVLGALPSHAADWTPTEQVKTYKVSGTTGAELYESIGAKGPLLGE